MVTKLKFLIFFPERETVVTDISEALYSLTKKLIMPQPAYKEDSAIVEIREEVDFLKPALPVSYCSVSFVSPVNCTSACTACTSHQPCVLTEFLDFNDLMAELVLGFKTSG